MRHFPAGPVIWPIGWFGVSIMRHLCSFFTIMWIVLNKVVKQEFTQIYHNKINALGFFMHIKNDSLEDYSQKCTQKLALILPQRVDHIELVTPIVLQYGVWHTEQKGRCKHRPSVRYISSLWIKCFGERSNKLPCKPVWPRSKDKHRILQDLDEGFLLRSRR